MSKLRGRTGREWESIARIWGGISGFGCEGTPDLGQRDSYVIALGVTIGYPDSRIAILIQFARGEHYRDTGMTTQIDIDDPKYREAARQMLWRHDNFEAEANVTSAVRDFLITTGLAASEEIIEENPPSEGSRRAVDLTALDTFIEVKRRISAAASGYPNAEYVRQLDDYLDQSAKDNRVRMGVLTDGRHWLLRWPNAGAPMMMPPHYFTLRDEDGWFSLYEWLRDEALFSQQDVPPDADNVARYFGPDSPSQQRDVTALNALYQSYAESETVRVKRRLWRDLLRAALGEVAGPGHDESIDDLFVRHMYLCAVLSMVVQASFGIDIRRLAETDPADLLDGREFYNSTGLRGVLESDFFSWPKEVGANPLLRTLARKVARFDWKQAPTDTASTLYVTVIPPEERRQLGEYYTPAWLARTMVRELVDKPLEQRVLDPACGSGTFLAEAVSHFVDAASDAGWEPGKVVNGLRRAVTGIDVHPAAAQLARTAWTLAARPAIDAASRAGVDADLSIPVYLGDALQLRLRTGDLLAEHEITIQTGGEDDTELVFPVSLIDRAENFDAVIADVSTYITTGEDPYLALDDNHVTDEAEHETLRGTIATLQRLHDEGRDHVWAYYARNMVRPVALAREKVDVVIGNPPWINYNQTADVLRMELQRLSRGVYGIWAGGRYATHQDVAGLFFCRSVDLYLDQDGKIGFVMPHSALQAGQYSKWRTGRWPAGKGPGVRVDFTLAKAWDLERLEPNTFFPVPSSVVFARRLAPEAAAWPLAGEVERWTGEAGSADVVRVKAAITDTGVTGDSHYADYTSNGATIFPRVLFFVNETDNPAIVRAARTVTVSPRRGVYDKVPWKGLNLTDLTGQTIEDRHVFDVHLGETVAPYVTLDPLKALLPLRRGEDALRTDEDGPGGVSLRGLDRRMRQRWRTISGLWDENKAQVNKLSLLNQLDYYGKLSSQLRRQTDKDERAVRIVYNQSGNPTAAMLLDDASLVDYTLYWITCRDLYEANYLLAIINSNALYEAVEPLMPKGQFGARHLQKHLWKLPIPEFDAGVELHAEIAAAGKAAAAGAQKRLAAVREERGADVGVTIVRRELRRWLRASAEGRGVEEAVGRLLGGG